MSAFAKTCARVVLNALPASVACRLEYRRQRFTHFNERPVEFAFVFRQIARLAPMRILDVGTGTTALPHTMRNCGALVTAIDNVRDYWPTGMSNRHFHVIDDDVTRTKLDETFDLVTCVSVLEHVEQFDDAVASMARLTSPGGHLVITCPFTERAYHANVYAMDGSSYGQDAGFVTQSYSREQVDAWCAANDLELVEQEFWRYWTGDAWTLGEQVIPPEAASAETPHQHTCMLFRRRDDG